MAFFVLDNGLFLPSTTRATYAILLAIAHRERTGKRQWIDLSQYQAGVVQLGEAFRDYTMNERIPTRRGHSHPNFAPYGVYTCSGDDSWVAVTITSDAEWMNFRRAAGKKWAGDLELETTASRRIFSDSGRLAPHAPNS